MDLIGRERELAAVRELAAGESDGPRALVLEGEPGIGKTTLWSSGLSEARARGYTVLACSPSEPESQLSFTGLGDLLAEVPDEARANLPHPQRRALDVALLFEEAHGEPPEPRAIGTALLGVLRTLSRDRSVLVAVDDLQWLDQSTAFVLAFAVRRLRDERVALLLSTRPNDNRSHGRGLVSALPEARRTLEVAPLTVGALHALLRTHLGMALPRPTLFLLHEASGGNPFYALEIGRALETTPQQREPRLTLPVPDTLQALVRDRLATLPEKTRDALTLAAIAANPTISLLEAAMPKAQLELTTALSSGIITLDRGRVAFAHRLYAAALTAAADEQRLQAAHRRLADVVADPEQRARHLAHGTNAPDEDVAATLDAAARLAEARGAPATAAALLEHGARLTPTAAAADRRLLEAASLHYSAGDPERSRTILEDLVARLEPGPLRARAQVELAYPATVREGLELCERAVAEAGEDPQLQAEAHRRLALHAYYAGDIDEAANAAASAAAFAEVSGDPTLIAYTLAMSAYLGCMTGQARWDELRRAVELEASLSRRPLVARPTSLLGLALRIAGRHDEARPLLEDQIERARDTGDEAAHALALARLAELEAESGRWDAARRLAEEAITVSEHASAPGDRVTPLYAFALVATVAGEIEAAHAAANAALAIVEADRYHPVEVQVRGVLGLLELSVDNPSKARAALDPAVELVVSRGYPDLSASSVIVNATEALVALGEVDAAATLTAEIPRARPLNPAWCSATRARLDALVAAARGDLETARSAARSAVAAYAELPDLFERARMLLLRGELERRAKQKRLARECLGDAVATFEAIPAPRWADKARAELARVGGRGPASEGLTETERRVAALVARGLPNAEVAAALFITRQTVEKHLTRVYAKLGVRSRAELARRFAADEAAAAE